MLTRSINKRNEWHVEFYKFGGCESMSEKTSKKPNFLKSVASEMRKVSWPKKPQLIRYTMVVIVTVVFMAIYFGVVDFGIGQLIDWYMKL